MLGNTIDVKHAARDKTELCVMVFIINREFSHANMKRIQCCVAYNLPQISIEIYSQKIKSLKASVNTPAGSFRNNQLFRNGSVVTTIVTVHLRRTVE